MTLNIRVIYKEIIKGGCFEQKRERFLSYVTLFYFLLNTTYGYSFIVLLN